ncbi:hypothetical protein K432DRAFT_463249 [Lepidopterella palustris CBS 459.81]|uniref:DUF7730 domain-containing protein n=1 Tax=Lepidopterella palustris CBS 459.81 TaxID=1314670 RepID=A0A8E2EHF5_9PEZI|nr:hypothetical protein K432DRAFT_463249 [Lepidopterella palustris CBS 459.81]
MTNFFDLLEPVRFKIYRLHLCRSKPIEPDGTWVNIPLPKLLLTDQRISEEAKPIYFAENHFRLPGLRGLYTFLRSLKPAEARHIRQISFDYHGPYATEAFTLLKKLQSLEKLTIGVSETYFVRDKCHIQDGYRTCCMRPCDIPLHLNMLVLRHTGMDALRQLWGINSVKFTVWLKPQETHSWDISWKYQPSGPIPGGVLQTVVAKEMMRPKVVSPTTAEMKTQSMTEVAQCREPPKGFRFLDLPAEIRNRIYDLVFVFHDGVNPSKRDPITHYRSGVHHKSQKFRSGPTPFSSLALLQVCRQIHDEAHGILYAKNNLIFYYPTHLHFFLCALSESRLNYIREITLWYDNKAEGGMDTIDLTLPLLRSLKSLKKLHIVFEKSHQIRLRYSTDWPKRVADLKFGGHDTLRKLIQPGGLETITLRIQELDWEIYESQRTKLPIAVGDLKRKLHMLKVLEREINGDMDAELSD